MSDRAKCMLTGVILVFLAYGVYVAQRALLWNSNLDGPLVAWFSAVLVYALVYPFSILGGVCLLLSLMSDGLLWPKIGELKRLEDSDAYRKMKSLTSLVEKEGIAATDLRPVGVVCIDEEKYDAFSESGLVEQGCLVIVTGTQSGQLVVRVGDSLCVPRKDT